MRKLGLGRSTVVVVIAWEDHVLQVRTLRPKRVFGLGDGRGGFPLPPGILPEGRSHRAVVTYRGCLPHLVVPPRARGWIAPAGARRRSFDELELGSPVFRAAPYQAFPSGAELPLAVGTSVRLELGPLTLWVSRPHPSTPALAWRRPKTDVGRLAACFAVTAATLVALLVVAAQALPPLLATPELIPPMDAWFGLKLAVDPVAEPELDYPPLELSNVAAEPPVYRVADPVRCCIDRAMGHPELVEGVGSYGVKGPEDNPDPHIARLRGHRESWFWSVVGWERQPAATAPLITPWGRDSSLGRDAIDARGPLWGDERGDAPGRDGLGWAEDEGGLVKAIETDPKGAGEAGSGPRLLHTGLRVDGPLRPSAVLRMVAPRLSRMQGCYAEALGRDPELGGRVILQFAIRGVGTSTDVRVLATDIADDGLTRCLTAAFDGLLFPPADGQGNTVVSYPLHLMPGSAVGQP